MAGHEIVEADDRLIERKQRLEQIRTDEPGDARHQPVFGASRSARRAVS